MKSIPKPKIEVLERRGSVELLLLVTDMDVRFYAVRCPQKVGGQDSTAKITYQFMRQDEAVREFNRFATFFEKREAHNER